LSSRNAAILAEVEREIDGYRSRAREGVDPYVGNPCRGYRLGPWSERSEEEWFTRLAIDARLICADCLEPLGDGFYLVGVCRRKYRTDSGRPQCARCRSSHAEDQRDEGYEKTCRCGVSFVIVYHDYRALPVNDPLCSPRCERLAQSENQRDRRAGLHGTRTCEHCGREFVPTRADARYCSTAHQQAAYRASQAS
jgi:hypothetical protein